MIGRSGKHEDPKKIRRRRVRTILLFMILVTGLCIGGYTYVSHKLLPAMENVQQQQTAVAENTASVEKSTLEPATPEPTVEPTPEPTVTPELSIMMVGDDLLHEPVSESGKQIDGSYNYDAMFRNIKEDAEAADLSMINQEVLLGGEKLGITGYPSFNGRYEVGDSIADAGFNLILHATNHALDRGTQGVKNCLKFWKKKHPEMIVTGLYNSQKKQDQITYFEKNGIRVAVLNYTYGTNGIPMPADMPYAVNMLTKERVSTDMKKAKKNADFIIVCPHWGTEYNIGTDAYQQQWTQYFLEQGVNLVIGTHPHVVEPVKWVKDNKGNKMLVYYSLGNFVNSSNIRKPGVARQFYGGMAKVNLQRKEDGTVKINTASFVPLVTHWAKDSSLITTYKVSDYSQKMAQNNRVSDTDAQFSYANCKLFFKNLIKKKFLEPGSI